MPSHRFSREELSAAPAAGFRQRLEVRLQDVDAAGLVFFVRILEFFHDGLMAYIRDSGVSMAQLLRDGAVLTPVKHAEADYFAPLRFGDALEVELVRAHLEDTEVVVGFRLVRLPDRRVVAVGQTAHVCIDPRTGTRSPLPGPVAAALGRLEPSF